MNTLLYNCIQELGNTTQQKAENDMTHYTAKARQASHMRMVDMNYIKPVVKRMIIEGCTVPQIKAEIVTYNVPAAAYDRLVSHGYVKKWRAL